MRASRLAVFGIVLAIAGVVTLVLTRTSPEQAHACAPGPYECLPDVALTDINGVQWDAQALAGKVVIVNFWATWCGPCVHEIPLLTQAYEKYHDDGLVVLGIMTDAVSKEQLEHFSQKHGLRYPIVRSTEQHMIAFDQPEALPTTFIYNRQGKLHTRHIGPLSAHMLGDTLPLAN